MKAKIKKLDNKLSTPTLKTVAFVVSCVWLFFFFLKKIKVVNIVDIKKNTQKTKNS